jgi:hypothetical protein
MSKKGEPLAKKNNLVPEVIEKQAGHGTTFKVCLPAAEIR